MSTKISTSIMNKVFTRALEIMRKVVVASMWMCSLPVPMKFLGIVGQDPSDSKSNWIHVDIFRFFFHSFEVCFI